MYTLEETKIGGLLLILGTLLFLVTVFFEFNIGWIGLFGGPEDPYGFIAEHWPSMKVIWSWQMVGGILTLLSFFLFYKKAGGIKSAIWASLMIRELLSTAAFMFMLGSYGPALEVLDTSPELFGAIRGGVSSLYQNIMIGPFLFIVIFCWESFSAKGIIKKKWGLTALMLVVIVLMFGLIFGISLKIAGLSYFLLPIVLGYYQMTERK